MKLDHFGFIYITTNKLNGVRYIGQHTKFYDSYLGSGIVLCRAIEKYGRENFERKILEYADTKEELDSLEKEYIRKYNAVDDPMFYNIAIGGGAISYWNERERPKFRKTISGKRNGMYDNGHILIGKMAGENNPSYGRKGRPHKKVFMMDLEFNILQEFGSMAALWRYCLKNFEDDRGPGTKDRLYIRGRQIYNEKYYFCKESELEDFLNEKMVAFPLEAGD